LRFWASVGPFASLVCLRGLLLLLLLRLPFACALSTWGQLTSQSSRTEVITAVFCESAIESAQNDQFTVVQSILANKESHLEKARGVERTATQPHTHTRWHTEEQYRTLQAKRL